MQICVDTYFKKKKFNHSKEYQILSCNCVIFSTNKVGLLSPLTSEDVPDTAPDSFKVL